MAVGQLLGCMFPVTPQLNAMMLIMMQVTVILCLLIQTWEAPHIDLSSLLGDLNVSEGC